VLSREGILSCLNGDFPPERIHVFKSLESTNLTAKKMALDGASSGTVVIAGEQTGGRGRMGRSFYSPPDGGIYMSFILKPQFDAAKSVLITTAASVAVCKAIENITGISCRIKWVNDIYLGEKKICGILTEAVTDFESGHIDYIVCGIGINYSTSFPEELSGIAGALFESPSPVGYLSAGEKLSAGREISLGKDVSRNRLIAEIISQILAISENLDAKTFIEDYRSRSFVLGKEILIIPRAGNDGERNLADGIPAEAVDIDEDGGLVVKYRDGSLGTLNSGEISIRTVK
jgi:BirA family biotin operon repressor/biotin-[acetyl-CoA-carboxylase] ligase